MGDHSTGPDKFTGYIQYYAAGINAKFPNSNSFHLYSLTAK